MEVALGPLLVIAVLLVVLGAKRGAEAAQRERERRWRRVPVSPVVDRPVPSQGMPEVELRPAAVAGARRRTGALRAAPPAAARQPGALPAEAADGHLADAAVAPTAASPDDSGTIRGLRSALAALSASAQTPSQAAPASGERGEGRTQAPPPAPARPPQSKAPERPVAVPPQPAPPPIDVNTASAEQLRNLPGVGIRAAERIVAHRQRHGPFVSVEDLEAVEGFDPHRVSRLAPRARV